MKPERRIIDLPHGAGRRYCVVGPKMGVDFHFSGVGYDVSAGLEMHYLERPSYMEGQEPFSENCWLTGCRCWSDGTSLYATEYLYPMFKERGVEAFWPVLEKEYEERLKYAFGEAS